MGYIFSRDNIQPAEKRVIYKRVEIQNRDPDGAEANVGMGILRNPPRYSIGELRAMQPATTKPAKVEPAPIFRRPEPVTDAFRRRLRRDKLKEFRS